MPEGVECDSVKGVLQKGAGPGGVSNAMRPELLQGQDDSRLSIDHRHQHARRAANSSNSSASLDPWTAALSDG